MARNRSIPGGRPGEAAVTNPLSDRRVRPASGQAEPAAAPRREIAGRAVALAAAPITVPGRAANPPAAAAAAAPDNDIKPPVRLDALSSPAARAAGGSAALPDVEVEVKLIRGGLTNVVAPAAVSAHYKGLAFAGSAKAFDERLDSLLTRARDLGMIGMELGQLFHFNLEQHRKAGKVDQLNVDNLLIAGMGEPGRFAADGLRYLMSNVTVAIKVMGHDQFATSLLGTRRGELPAGLAVRAFLTGILDGYERLRAIADSARDDQDCLRQAASTKLSVLLVAPDEEKLKQIKDAFKLLEAQNSIPGLKLQVDKNDGVVHPDKSDREDANQADPESERVTYLRIARKGPAAPAAQLAPAAAAVGTTETFEFSALSEVSAVSVREVEISSYLVQRLPGRLTAPLCPPQKREELGRFFGDLVIPEEFRALMEGSANLTLEVDEATAAFPWEMIAQKNFSNTSFLGTSMRVSRQFRSLLSPPPASPPPLNRQLKVLVIADPAPGRLSLPEARLEGFAVIQILAQARSAWKGRYDIQATIRIGSGTNPELEKQLAEWEEQDWVVSAAVCDPVDIAMLIVNEQYDVIHFAGHGFADPKTGRTGWILDKECELSAQEIFRVRQVPRLVFANACFSASATGDEETPLDNGKERKRLVGVACAFFKRGVPNFIGAGWTVDDACARRFAECFYASVLGLSRPDENGNAGTTQAPGTISASLVEARLAAYQLKQQSSTWGAYQHYGRISDKLLAPPNATTTEAPKAGTRRRAVVSASPNPEASDTSTIVTVSAANTVNAAFPVSGGTQMPTSATAHGTATPDISPDLVYVNGIDPEMGTPAIPPMPIEDLAKTVRLRPGGTPVKELRGDTSRAFGLPYNMDANKLEESGWGIVFHEDTPQDVRNALAPLIASRKDQAKTCFKELIYKKGEQTREWYQRQGISVGGLDPEIVPYYLLLVGPPDMIPFEFQYLLGIEYAVGRLAFDTAAEYEHYALSLLAYESASTVPTAKEIVFWGTRHLGDGATNLSASLLVDPLANGIAGAPGALKKPPIGSATGFGQKLFLGDDATKETLLATLHAGKPPALLFTASHGMAIQPGRPKQLTDQGALLCQDWPGYGSVKAEHFLAAADVADDANVNGLVAFVFACFGAGTPDADQFAMDLGKAGQMPPLAPKPFISALPRRLLTHPNGGALAVIGHIDRAWGFSIQGPNTAGPQIGTFRNSLGSILTGSPIGHAVAQTFGAKFAELSTTLLSAISPTAPSAYRPSDRELVTYWLERNDAQNYVMLGDPAARIRKDLLA